MKILLKNCTMIFIATIVFTSIVGCSQSSNPNENNFDKDKFENTELNSHGDTQVESNLHETAAPYSGLDIEINNINEKVDFKEEVIKQILKARTIKARTIDEKQEDYQYYADTKLWDIVEFYFPTNKIDGYELCGVVSSENLLRFFYSPINEINKDKYQFDYSTGIRISIERMDDTFASAPLKAILEQYEEQKFEYKYENNVIFNETLKSANGQIGESRFRYTINVPDELYSVEFMQKLNDQILQTAELVIVK